MFRLTWLRAMEDTAFRRLCVLSAGAGVLAWVTVLLSVPSLYPEGGWEGNAPWRDQVPRGIRLVGDTPRYILGADNLLAGRTLENKQGSYLGYVAIVAVCRGLGLGLQGVVAVHVLLALASLPCLYSLAHHVGGRWAAALTVVAYGLNPEVAAWHTIIQTDSVYISGLVIVVWLAAVARERSRGFRIGAGAACAAIVFIRPNGWIVPPALGVHAILTAPWRMRARALAVAAVALVGLGAAFGVHSLRQGIEAESPVRMLYQGEVLWGNAAWRMAMPPAPADASAWGPAFRYVARHPLACARLALVRLGVFLARVRPGYSLRHNLFLLFVYPPLNLLALAGVARSFRQPAGGAMAAVIAGHLLIVALTFAHQDGRFYLYVFPELLALASAPSSALLASLTARLWGEVGGRRRKTA